MTPEQTRRLGIEFERRIQQIYPQFATEEKLDTNTIYSFLSEYQYKYIDNLFLSEDQVERGTNAANKISDILKSLIKHQQIASPDRQVDSDDYSDLFTLPSDYYMYIRSNSIIDKTYKDQVKRENPIHTPNLIIKQSDVPHVVGASYNQGNIIRTPLVVLESTKQGSHYLKVIHDKYTHVDAVDLVYMRYPYKFNVLNFNDNDKSSGAIHSSCELPFFCFESVVLALLHLDRYLVELLCGKQQWLFSLLVNQAYPKTY